MLSYNGIIDKQKHRCMHANNEKVGNAGVSKKGNGDTKNQIGTAKRKLEHQKSDGNKKERPKKGRQTKIASMLKSNDHEMRVK